MGYFEKEAKDKVIDDMKNRIYKSALFGAGRGLFAGGYLLARGYINSSKGNLPNQDEIDINSQKIDENLAQNSKNNKNNDNSDIINSSKPKYLADAKRYCAEFNDPLLKKK